MSKKLFFNIFKFIVFLGFGIFLLWLIMRNVDEDQKAEIKESFLHANYWWVLLSVAIGILSHVLRAVKWKMMLEPLGKSPRLLTTFYSVMIGYLVNMAIPRLGEVTRCGILQRYEKIPFDKSLGTLVVERSIDLLSLI
ncbi:MAG: flippase-like domain-containing protein, partial [Fimbriimonadaceae bacterium]|nr:flippase-like domain-containing protein [Chitinophagales bacterium]